MAGTVVLATLADATDTAEPAPWATDLLALGLRLARRAVPVPGTRLIVVVTVPTRELAASLIVAGWVLADCAPASPSSVADTLAERPNGDVAVINGSQDRLLVGPLGFGDVPMRFQVCGTWFDSERVSEVFATSSALQGQSPLSKGGGVITFVGKDATWALEQATAAPDATIVGALTEIEADLGARVGHSDHPGVLHTFEELLRTCRPAADLRADAALERVNPRVWKRSSHVAFPEPELGDGEEGAVDVASGRLLVLDGNAAVVNCLESSRAPVTVAVIDRSTTAEEATLMFGSVHRHDGTGNKPPALGWAPPAGIEYTMVEVAQ